MRSEQLRDPDGIRFVPHEPSGIGVLTIAGSSGRVDAERARVFAAHGALAESVRWFGGPGQHFGPWEIPIELFQARLASLALDSDRLVIVGTSFGAEAALLTASLSESVHAAICFAPSDVVWAGVRDDGTQTSHWTVAGQSVPFVPFVEEWEASDHPPSFAPLCSKRRAANPVAVQRASIRAERVPEVVLIAGGDDRVWPAVDHAKQIEARRSEHGLHTTVVTDPDAGHRTVLPGESVVVSGMRMARGGTEVADRRLGVRAWHAIEPLLRL